MLSPLSFIAYPKINVFLKIVGTRDGYHTLLSRFVLVKEMYDTLTFHPSPRSHKLNITGNFNCSLENNTLFKAVTHLQEALRSSKLDDFVFTHELHVEKKIPSFAGLGGGSSDAAGVLDFLNNHLSLGLTLQELNKIGLKIGADVPFFLSGAVSANVSGIGEIIEPFDEPPLSVDIHTNSVECSTPLVYQHFRNNFLSEIDPLFARELSQKSSQEILSVYDAIQLNDLFRSATKLYPQLLAYAHKGSFFSGSGSAFFSLKGSNE